MKKIIIIGGGLSGLSAGVYALKSNYDVTIIEKNNEVGGLCTTWMKDGATIDGCIHWLTGSAKGNLIPIYKDLGIWDNLEIQKLDYFYKFYYKDIEIEVSRNEADLKNTLYSYAIEDDKSRLNFFFKLVKRFRNVPFHSGKPYYVMKKTELIAYIKKIATFAFAWVKSIKISLGEFANSFKSDILKHFFLSFMPPYYSLTYYAGIISMFTIGNADTIYITSKDLALKIKDKFLELGGKIVNNEAIEKLNIDNNSLLSIESKDNKYEADYFINASPLPYFYNKLLPIQYHDTYVDYIFSDEDDYPLLSTVYISFKLDKDYKEKLDAYTLIYDEEGISVGDSHNETLHYRAYPYIKNSDGSTTLICLIDLHVREYDIFKKAKESGTYEKYKMLLAEKALNIYVKRFPKAKDHIKIIDVATPLTFENKTNTYKGAYLSNLATPYGERKTFEFKDRYISNLYHAGQWITQIGGIPRSLSNGKFAVDTLNYYIEKESKKDKKKN